MIRAIELDDDPTPIRPQKQVRRLLYLIDLLAAKVLFHTALEINAELNERLGCRFCCRTTYRDLHLLAEMGFVRIGSLPNQKRRGGPHRVGFRLDLTRAERLQEVAMVMIDGPDEQGDAL